MKRFLFSRLRTRIFLLVVISFLPAVALAIYSTGEHRKICIAEVHRHSLNMARLIKNNYDNLIKGARQLFIGFEQVDAVYAGATGKCNALLCKVKRQFPFYDNLGVVEIQIKEEN